jgi:hypothetical protein
VRERGHDDQRVERDHEERRRAEPEHPSEADGGRRRRREAVRFHGDLLERLLREGVR